MRRLLEVFTPLGLALTAAVVTLVLMLPIVAIVKNVGEGSDSRPDRRLAPVASASPAPASDRRLPIVAKVARLLAHEDKAGFDRLRERTGCEFSDGHATFVDTEAEAQQKAEGFPYDTHYTGYAQMPEPDTRYLVIAVRVSC